MCVPLANPARGTDGSYCPNNCPLPLLPGQVQCPQNPRRPLNKGCHWPDLIISPSGTGRDGTACPARCPNWCSWKKKRCCGRVDSNGCPLPCSCVKRGELCEEEK